jgi:beta-phosphoglucomutase-like phosphatase (HAD superfamily)
MHKLKYVLWDLDGTIVDSENFDFKNRIFTTATARIGLRFDLEYQQFNGKEAKSIFNSILVKNCVDEHNRHLHDRYDEWYEDCVREIINSSHLVTLRSGVGEGFKKFGELGLCQGVVTSSRCDVANSYLKAHNLLQYIDLIVARGDVKVPKPSPEPYQMAVSRLGIRSNECIAIEDSNSGIASAKSAGISVIGWVEDHYNLAAENTPDFLIKDASFEGVYDTIISLMK